jgi:hypothetical protein
MGKTTKLFGDIYATVSFQKNDLDTSSLSQKGPQMIADLSLQQ